MFQREREREREREKGRDREREMSGPDPEFNTLGWHNQARGQGSHIGAPTKPT